MTPGPPRRGGLRRAAIAAAALGCVRAPGPPAAPLALEDRARDRGLERVLRSGSPEKLTILESIGTGCGLLDADGDGRLDIYLPNAGSLVDGRMVPGPGPALYVQTSGGRFADRTREAGLESRAWQTGVAAGDIDNDGHVDLLVCAFGEVALHRNRGDGSFEDITAASGLAGRRFHTSALFLDYDRDGLLDLYIAAYVKLDPERPGAGVEPCIVDGVRVACGPSHHEPEPDVLYHNEGGARFLDVTRATGVHREEGAYGLGVAAVDANGDGWPDIYVANDSTANFLWINQAGAGFREEALERGAALGETGRGEAGMGVDCADLDADGAPEVFVTNYALEHNALYVGGEAGAFEHRTQQAGLGAEDFRSLGWGARFIDLDLDGWLDLAVANGHVHPQAPELSARLPYRQPLGLFRGLGSGRFEAWEGSLGEAARTPRAHRGLAAGDIDDDGDIDLLASVVDGPAALLEARAAAAARGGWISLQLVGVRSNRDAAGARVVVLAGSLRQARTVTRGGSYLSAQDPRVHVGLGGAPRADRIEVTWPSGAAESFGPLEGGARYRIVEGAGRAERLAP